MVNDNENTARKIDSKLMIVMTSQHDNDYGDGDKGEGDHDHDDDDDDDDDDDGGDYGKHDVENCDVDDRANRNDHEEESSCGYTMTDKG